MRVLVVVAAAVVAVLMVAGCGDGGKTTGRAGEGSSNSAPTTAAPPIPLPTPADLNAAVMIAFDPSIPAAQKSSAVEGGKEDPNLAPMLAQAAQNNHITVAVTEVRYDSGQGIMNALATIAISGNPVAGQTVVPFVVEDGRWKLQKAWTCQMLANAALTSPACAA